MTDLYLIAHKVSGEPAFDIACRMTCPECAEQGCPECDDLGYWWIISTSGHRAYPWHYWPWDELACDSRVNASIFDPSPIIAPPMPPSLPDHYPTRSTPRISLAEALGLTKPKHQPLPPITRRI